MCRARPQLGFGESRVEFAGIFQFLGEGRWNSADIVRALSCIIVLLDSEPKNQKKDRKRKNERTKESQKRNQAVLLESLAAMSTEFGILHRSLPTAPTIHGELAATAATKHCIRLRCI